MSARTTTRTRLFAATTVALAALALTACENGQGVHHEGVSSASNAAPQPGRSESTKGSTARPAEAGTSTNGDSTTDGSTSGGSKSGGSTTGGSTDQETEASDTTSRNTPCSGTNTKTTATEVSRPLNHLLLTVANTGSKYCDLTGYPKARFGGAQAVPAVFEETHPQAVVTLAPGESGYAGVLLAAADGSGENGYMAKTLVVTFDSGGTAAPALPTKGVYVDETLAVTYWQSDLSDALAY
ncbi:DUF4232 domain-containing protein [Streptomyces sp.]|uniref:DUF4232 domain-containing protein n=1 Tax=Streptomyces sp. TaxID=1931 RepID=UPI002F4201C6